MQRCFGDGDPLYEAYHDDEWGVPITDERALFERIVLESFQSGLAWITILRKRDAFRSAFAGFDIAAVAAFDDADVERLLGDAGIGRLLLGRLLEVANESGFLAVFGRIVGGHEASIALHRALGFEIIGVVKEVGRKFGRWLVVVVVE